MCKSFKSSSCGRKRAKYLSKFFVLDKLFKNEVIQQLNIHVSNPELFQTISREITPIQQYM